MTQFFSVPIPVALLDAVVAWDHHQQQQQQCGQHCCWQQQPPQTFSFASSSTNSTSRRTARAPFARLSATQQPAAQELFSLVQSRLSSYSGSSSSSEVVDGSSASSSGYESDTDTDAGYSTDLHLDQINCQMCKRPLNQRPGKRRLLSWPWGGGKGKKSSKQGHSSEFLVCDCCQRCYHRHCCKQRGVSTKERDGVWFHDPSCKDCLQQLQDKVASGATALPGGRSWRLIDCAPVDPQGKGGAKALQALKQQLSDVLEVMLPAFGPGAAQQLVDTTKGYAVLLKKGSLPLTAGLLDVYGKELAVLDLVATSMEQQGQGHCRTLLRALEGWLGPELGVASLVAVCPADEPLNIRVFSDKFGFKRLSPKALQTLKTSVPALNYYEESTLLAKQLDKRQRLAGSKKQQQQQKQAEAGKGGKPQQDAAGSLPVQPLEGSAGGAAA